MSSPITEMRAQIEDAVNVPALKLEKHSEWKSPSNNINPFLTSKYVAKIDNDHKEEIFKRDPDVLFPEYRLFYNNMTNTTVSEKDYSGIVDATDLAEYFPATKRFVVDPDYLKYIKASDNGYIINIYGDELSFASTPVILNDPVKNNNMELFMSRKLPATGLITPSEVNYAVFNKTVYADKMLLETCQDYVSILCTNIPYSYYRTQNVAGNIFTWNIDSGEYQIGGKSIPEINDLINEIARNGISPIVARIHNGNISVTDTENAIRLFIATYLNLPEIPVIMYMSDEEGVINKYLDEIRAASLNNISADLMTINLICKPYFFFEDKKSDIDDAFFRIGSEKLLRARYASPNNLLDKSINVVDWYLDNSVEIKESDIAMMDISVEDQMELDLEKVRKELQDRLKAEAEDHIAKIKSGEFTKSVKE